MSSVSPISAVSASQYNWQQFRLQQARRSADQLESTAQSLQTQASDARRVANQDQDTANSLTAQADRAQQDADQSQLTLTMMLNGQGQYKGALINTVA